jgi:hypothetical protein
MKRIKIFFARLSAVLTIALFATPAFAFAASQTLKDLSRSIVDLIQSAIPILSSITFIVFLWGVKNYVASGGDETKIKDGRTMMIYGIIGLAVMLSVWGLVRILTNTVLGGVGF